MTCLGVYLNPIGDGGALALAQMLGKNHTLTTVDVHGCLYKEKRGQRYGQEEVGITELYSGGCGCKVLTPYDGKTYMA